jgi:hypothetical protein
MPLRDMMNDTVRLIKADGRRFDNIQAHVQSNMIFTADAHIPIEEGDTFERDLQSGVTEKYRVTNAGFYAAGNGIPAHYQSRVEKITRLDNPRHQQSHLIPANVQIHISDSTIGILNPGEITNVQSLTVNVSSLAESGNAEVANALKHLTEAVAASQELTTEQRAEALDWLEELSKQANLSKEKRLKPASLRAVAMALASACSAAGGLSTVWNTWGSVIKAFFRF